MEWDERTKGWMYENVLFFSLGKSVAPSISSITIPTISFDVERLKAAFWRDDHLPLKLFLFADVAVAEVGVVGAGEVLVERRWVDNVGVGVAGL
jgi:hypothetical protein